MDFRLNDDQQALREGIRSFCDGRIPADRLPELEGAGFDRELWSELAEMGVFSLRLPESDGGVGLGNADGVLVFQELGRRLVPGPVLWSHLAAGLIEGAASGETVVGGVDRLGALREPLLIGHWEHLDALLVLGPDGIERVDPRAAKAEAVATPFDPLTPVHHVTGLPAGERIGDADAARRLRWEGLALLSGLFLGITEVTQELATAYAKEREQFDRPIGSFQAVKHILSDMFVRQELARAAAYAAGATLDDPEVGDPERAVAGARLITGETAHKNARACIQVYGGMGYTWEIPAHYYLKRTWVLETELGSLDEAADHVVRRVEAGL